MKKFEHWQIAWKTKNTSEFSVLQNPKWAWAADPFLVEYKGRLFLFAELFLYKSERNGVIGYCEFNGHGFDDWKVTMDRHWHLSYPNVWVQDEKLYMCPETYQAEEVSIYELVSFPDQWRKVYILLDDGRYVDNTFMRYEGKDYLFTYKLSGSAINGKLLLYRIMENGKLSDPICVSEDIGNARPGGKIIYNNNKVIRVSQDSKNGYGSGLVFSEVLNVFPVYKEKEIIRICPEDIVGNWKRRIKGIHTYNICGDLEVIDLKYESACVEEFIARRRVRKVFTNKY